MMCICFPTSLLFVYVLLVSILMLRCSSRNCLEEGSVIRDGTNDNTLVSPGGVFELGFFTPGGNNDKNRFLGIWYYIHNNQPNTKIFVWVANRNNPLLDSSGYLIVKDGIAKVLDVKDAAYWSTEITPSRNASYCLQDSGNFITFNRSGGRGNQGVWQSFDYPTDTFLPGMDGADITFTSWETSNNPAQGTYTFMIQRDKDNKLIVSKQGSSRYWDDEDAVFYHTPPILYKNISLMEDYNYTRLVMNFTGQLQFWKWESERGWFLNWSEPNDRCDLHKICGNFGSCNSNSGLLCKCLPGFFPSSPERWNSENYLEGCAPRSLTCSRDYYDDVFLRMPMMKVITQNNETNVRNCTDTCLKECSCVAYSCGVADCTGTSDDETCLMWYNELNGLQEEYRGGFTIFFRSASSEIELTSRDCKPCGTFIIPYPLSTSANCGDSSYFNFQCNEKTGQLSFLTSKGTFNVTSIDLETKIFSIQVGHDNSCHSEYINSVLSSVDPSRYNVMDCNVKEQPFLGAKQSFIEVWMNWKPPLEPPCHNLSDCQSWPLTTCKANQNGELRCYCQSSYDWDGQNVNCSKVNLPVKVVLPCLAAVLASIVMCGIFLIYHMRKTRPAKLQGSVDYKEDDPESIDVPFFSWETILDASSNFADTNKLGSGGFGSVYRGKLPDGREIAVKRLSSASVQGIAEFRTEVILIAKLQHRNLVRLLGYCMKADEKILVYEYMPNGSLDSCLFDDRHSVLLNWKERFDIILGIARGLLYLHQDSRLIVIHRDLKPSNILLDEELNPKISDFGIARIVGGKDTEASTRKVVGTYGYMSPEYASEGIFSVKSDVYSFGVVTLETIRGKRNSRIFMFEHGMSLLGHAWKMWNEDQALELMDPRLNESCIVSEVLKCIHIGLLCVQEDPSDRPTMSTVIHMLSGENPSLPPAKQPAFMNRKPLSESASSSSAKDLSVHEVMFVPAVGR